MFGFIRAFLTGDSFINQLLTGDFDRESRVGRLYAEWFDERPARSKQRAMFISILGNAGGRRGQVVDLLNGIIVKAMSGEVVFGDALAGEIERRIVSGPPNSPEQAQAQKDLKEQFARLTAQLRALDS